MSEPDRSWLIERVHLGERSPEELTEAERARLSVLGGQDQAILGEHPPRAVAEEVARRARRDVVAKPSVIRWSLVGLAPVCAVAALLFAVDFETPEIRPATVETTRLKGQAIVIHRKTDSGSESLAQGDRVASGDRLQLGFRLDQPAHAVLLSVDGRGAVTVHVPEATDEDVAPRFAAGLSRTPFSYVLDDAPVFERFFLLTSDRPFSVRQAEASALASTQVDDGAPVWPGAISGIELRLDKEAVR